MVFIPMRMWSLYRCEGGLYTEVRVGLYTEVKDGLYTDANVVFVPR